ncbi:hypothetical protein [Serratia liquefaciens]|jgi:hypothetical protein|uniref:hypothetical protein n=1 Tax=Serratia liquefaciens TaxID=614 RepID=UPI0021C9583A|nr:hypothetical protein [Serratia liquefaciens]
MNITEVGDTFNCDCGFSWTRGFSGSHDCGDGLRRQIADLKVQILANQQAQPVALIDRRPVSRRVVWRNDGDKLPHGTELFTAPPLPAAPATASDEMEPDPIDIFVAQVCGDISTSNH